MTTTYSKYPLSASTNGKQIKVTQTGSAGDTIHTAVSGTSGWDEIWLDATNSSTSIVKLTIQWGGTTDPDDSIIVGIPAQDGYHLIVAGNILQNGLVVSAFADTANVILIGGFVNRITSS